MTFNKAIEEKENGSITYFYVEYDFSNLGQQLITLDTKSYKTFRELSGVYQKVVVMLMVLQQNTKPIKYLILI